MVGTAAPGDVPTGAIFSARGVTLVAGAGPRERVPVDNVAFDLFPGETLGIDGELGSRKTLTILVLTGLLPPGIAVRSGWVVVEGPLDSAFRRQGACWSSRRDDRRDLSSPDGCARSVLHRRKPARSAEWKRLSRPERKARVVEALTLYAATLEYAYRKVSPDAVTGRLDGLPPLEALETIARSAFDQFCKVPDFIRLALQENLQGGRYYEKSPALRKMNRERLGVVERILERGWADGTIRDDVSALDVYINFVGLCAYHISARHSYQAFFDLDWSDPGVMRARRIDLRGDRPLRPQIGRGIRAPRARRRQGRPEARSRVGRRASCSFGEVDRAGALLDRVAERVNGRLQDWDHRRELFAVSAVAVARTAIELLGHLGVTRCASVAPIFVKFEAAPIVVRAYERKHAAHALLLPVDHVLVANRQVFERHFAPIVAYQIHRQYVVAGDAFEIISAVEAVRQVIGEYQSTTSSGWRRRWMIGACGKMRPMRPRWVSFSGILSVNQRGP